MKEITIVSVSGGKDSTALYILCMEYYGNDFIPIFADTGHEHPVTVNYVQNLHHLTGGPVVVCVKADFTRQLEKKKLKPSGNPMKDLVTWKGRVPSTKAQFCTEHLKLWPIRFYLETNFPKASWVMMTGIRKGESYKRSKITNPFSWNSFFDCISIMPLLYESEKSIFDLLEYYNVPPNPLYMAGNKRVGCYPCIHSNKSELSNLPEWAWNRLAEYEQATGRTWFPPSILPAAFRKDGQLPTIEMVRNWSKTSRGGSQYDLFKTKEVTDLPSCMTGFVTCE